MQSTAAMEAMANNSGRMVAAIEKRQRHDSWLKQANLYLRMGNEAKANEMLAMMEKDDTGETNVASIPGNIEINEEDNEEDEEDEDEDKGNEKEENDEDDDEESTHSSQEYDSQIVKPFKV